MLRNLIRLIPILVATSFSLSCGEKKVEPRVSKQKTNFFEGLPAKFSPTSLKNQMGKGQTDLLRCFAQDQIPWQLWDKNLLKLATDAQVPILALVCTPIGHTTGEVRKQLNLTGALRDTLSKNFICSVVDTRLHPEISKVCYYLCKEVKRPITFPMFICLTHEGLPMRPLSSFSVMDTSPPAFERKVGMALATLSKLWMENSENSVKSSHRFNQARQELFAFPSPSEGPKNDRIERFAKTARKLSSLYDDGNNDLDDIGGLPPTSSVELLALGSCSGSLTKEVRARCQTAAQKVAHQMRTGAIRDPLDRSYFYARRGKDWSLPVFTKTLESQAEVASMFLKTGALLQDDLLLNEGLSLLDEIESRWLSPGLINLSMDEAKESPDTFLWSLEILSEILTDEEQQLATLAFSLREEGNIPTGTDLLGDYYELNSLRNKVTLSELAKSLGRSENEISTSLDTIREKLLKKRMASTTFTREKVMVVNELLTVLKARIDRCQCNRKPEDLESALSTADLLIKDFWDKEEGLLRLKKGSEGQVPAGGSEYGEAAASLTFLYQRTLDPKWLQLAITIFDRGIRDHLSENDLLSEIRKENRVVRLRQHNVAMIFGPSSLGFIDLAASRLHALTGNESYRKILDKHAGILDLGVEKNPVNHTDYALSCALAAPATLAILRGDQTTPDAQALLTELNAPRYLPFLAIRPQESSHGLAPLDALPAHDGSPSVILIQDGKTLGEVSTPSDLVNLLESSLATSSR